MPWVNEKEQGIFHPCSYRSVCAIQFNKLELSAEELDAACRKCVRMEVTDTAALARVLDSMNLEYKIISATTADVFAKINVTQLTVALAKENCEVLSMQEKDESLESYYISLVGGGSNA